VTATSSSTVSEQQVLTFDPRQLDQDNDGRIDDTVVLEFRLVYESGRVALYSVNLALGQSLADAADSIGQQLVAAGLDARIYTLPNSTDRVIRVAGQQVGGSFDTVDSGSVTISMLNGVNVAIRLNSTIEIVRGWWDVEPEEN
jgi:hypothetical protein